MDDIKDRIYAVSQQLGIPRKNADDMIEQAEELPRLLKKLRDRHRRAALAFERKVNEQFDARERRAADERHRRERQIATAERKSRRGQRPLHERIASTLAEMALLEEGTRSSRMDSGRIHAASDGPTGLPTIESTLAEQWRDMFGRLIEAAELELDRARGWSTADDGDEDRTKRLLSYAGRSSLFVAFVENVSESHVRKLRLSNGLRAGDGMATRQDRAA